MTDTDMAEETPSEESENMAAAVRQQAEERKETLMRVWAAVFYGLSSFIIMVINKIVLTSYKFPSFNVLGLGQMATGIVLLYLAKLFSIVSFPDFSRDVIQKVWPLPLFYIGNLVFGLGGTQKLNLPMLTVLRRFSILFTMILEYFILSINPAYKVQLSVALMIVGSVIASGTDLGFDMLGYIFITINNICTAGNGVYTKKKLEAKSLGRYGVIFYNSLLTILPLLALVIIEDEFHKVAVFKAWRNPIFIFYFLLSCSMGFILNYATLLCTAYNSALTTTVVGVFKNLLVTYLGMVIGNDYIFSWPNFIGLNISVCGSFVYTYATFTSKKPTSSTRTGVMKV